MAYNQETADRICERLAAGESLRKAAGAFGLTHSTVLEWNATNEAFADQYARARAAGYALLADELVEIADDGENDTYTDDEGRVKTNQDVIARSRLRVDTRKWMLSKMLPKVYGDKLELAGAVTVKTSPADMSDDDLAAIASGRKLNSLASKVPENTGGYLPIIENYSNGDNNA